MSTRRPLQADVVVGEVPVATRAAGREVDADVKAFVDPHDGLSATVSVVREPSAPSPALQNARVAGQKHSLTWTSAL